MIVIILHFNMNRRMKYYSPCHVNVSYLDLLQGTVIKSENIVKKLDGFP